jgi:hypothetical protein
MSDIEPLFVVPEPNFRSRSPEVVCSDESIVEAAFAYFRKQGFPYSCLPLHVCFQEVNKLARTGNDELLNTSVGYKVADTYHPHRFDGFHVGHHSPTDRFQIDDWLRMCLSKSLKLDGFIAGDNIGGLRWASGCRPAFNFRPGFALFMYRKFCEPGATVLDTSTGYGGRLVGFLASSCGRYIGIDPSTKTRDGNARMARDFGRSDDVELICQPAEDVDVAEVQDRCDFAFTSPPYFCTEIYSEEKTQSCHRYDTGEGWRRGFLEPMMRLQFAALKPSKFSCVNVADAKIKSKSYPLVDWTIQAGEKAGFHYLRTKPFVLHRHLGSGGDENKHVARSESVVVFRKDSD